MSVSSREDLLRLLTEHREELGRLGVRRLGLFGSFARGDQHGQSDVDLLIEFERGQKSFDAYMKVAFFLEDLLERPVEALTPESLSPYLGPGILSEIDYVYSKD